MSCSNKARRATNNVLIILFVRVFTPENQHDLFLSGLRLCILQHSNSASIAPIPHHPRNENVCSQPNRPTKRSLSTPQPSNPSKKMTNMTKSNLCRWKSFRLNFFIFSNIISRLSYNILNLLSCIQDKFLCRILAATRNEVKDARGQMQPARLCVGLADCPYKLRRVAEHSSFHIVFSRFCSCLY